MHFLRGVTEYSFYLFTLAWYLMQCDNSHKFVKSKNPQTKNQSCKSAKNRKKVFEKANRQTAQINYKTKAKNRSEPETVPHQSEIFTHP